MFEHGSYKTGIGTAFNLSNEVEVPDVNVKVDVIDGKLTFMCADWDSYWALYSKLNQVVSSMRSCIKNEGPKNIKHLV